MRFKMAPRARRLPTCPCCMAGLEGFEDAKIGKQQNIQKGADGIGDKADDKADNQFLFRVHNHVDRCGRAGSGRTSGPVRFICSENSRFLAPLNS